MSAPEIQQMPTKRTVRTATLKVSGNNEQTIQDTIEEWEPKDSVELKTLAKGGIQVESVKVYATTEREAGDRALAEMLRLQALIDALAETRFQEQLAKSAKAVTSTGQKP